MKIIKVENYEEMSKKASDIFLKEISKNPSITVGFATGFTPLEFYRKLVKAYREGTDFSRVKSFNLDEYYPIKKRDKDSCYYYMFENFFNHVNIKKSNINILNGETENPEGECKKYEDKIKANPINIQILGVGSNGHIGFNEPYSTLNSQTRLVILNHDAPKERALTMGIRTIISSRKILLLASGNSKAEAIKCLINGKIDKSYPVSFLNTHKDLTVIIDKDAASYLIPALIPTKQVK